MFTDSILALRFFVKVLLETNANINNELNISDVYQSVKYTGLLAKFTWTPLGFIHFACDPMYFTLL